MIYYVIARKLTNALGQYFQALVDCLEAICDDVVVEISSLSSLLHGRT